MIIEYNSCKQTSLTNECSAEAAILRHSR